MAFSLIVLDEQFIEMIFRNRKDVIYYSSKLYIDHDHLLSSSTFLP